MKIRLGLLIGFLSLSAPLVRAADATNVTQDGNSTWKKLELFADNYKIVTCFGFEGTQTMTFACDSSFESIKKELMKSLAKGMEEIVLETGIVSGEQSPSKSPESESCLFSAGERTLYLSLVKVPLLGKKHLV